MPTNAARRSGAACSARMPSRSPSRSSAGLGAEVLVRPSPWRLGASQADLAAEWFTGWVGAACEQQPELAAETDGYTRRRLAQAAAGQLAVTVDHADLLVLPCERVSVGQSVWNRGESA